MKRLILALAFLPSIAWAQVTWVPGDAKIDGWNFNYTEPSPRCVWVQQAMHCFDEPKAQADQDIPLDLKIRRHRFGSDCFDGGGDTWICPIGANPALEIAPKPKAFVIVGEGDGIKCLLAYKGECLIMGRKLTVE